MNAVAHREYSIMGTDIQIKMFDDHFTVESPGILPGLVRISNIREFHFSRSPKIVELLTEYDFVKEMGEGVDRVYREMAEAGLPEPEYKQSEFMLYATLKNKTWGQEDTSWGSYHAVFEKGHEKGREKGHEKKSAEIEQRIEQVRLLLRSYPEMSISDISNELGITEKQVRIAIDRLKAKKKIHFEGSGRGGRWVVDVS